jgi:ABC-type transport system substrate-binding protein
MSGRYQRLGWVVSALTIGSLLLMTQGATRVTAAGARSHAATTCAKPDVATGVFKYSDWQFPDTLNIYQTGASVSLETINIMIESLGLLRPNATLLPDVAQSIKGSNGGKTWTVTLRPNVRWSDGHVTTSADVKFSWEIYNNPASGPYAPGIGADQIARIDTPSKYVAVFHMKEAYAPFLLETAGLHCLAQRVAGRVVDG